MAPYVLNLWYLAAWADEIPGDVLLVRTLLDRPWILWRRSDGEYVMMRDRCAHRFAPLSMGERVGDVIRCGYHGLGYDASGRCVHSPFPDRTPPVAKVETLLLVERHGGLWFWPGDPVLADQSSIPDFAFIEAPNHIRGHLTMQANYELVADNLMDLSHAEFLHKDTFGVNGSLFGGRHQVRVEDDGAVWNNWDISDAIPPEWARPTIPDGGRVDQWLHMRWQAPASMTLYIGLAHAGSEKQTMIVPPMVNPHIITPETMHSSHYFYTREPGDESADLARRVFEEEDEPMIEAIQSELGDHDLWECDPISLSTDAGAIRARRTLMKLRKLEATSPPS